MRFKCLDGPEVTVRINPAKYPIRSREASRSNGQYHLGKKLRIVYPQCSILEEWGIPGSRLSLDFFIPSRKLAFEFQGIQHDEFNSFFHANKAAFAAQKKRDADKRRWCELNSIALVEVRDGAINAADLRALILEAIDAD